MQGSVINNGIIITAQDNASATFGVIGRSFQHLRQEFSVGAKEIPQKTQKAFKPFSQFRSLLSTNLKQGFQEGHEVLDHEFEAFNMTVRKKINTFNSIIMGGVAIAMSGLGIRRAGQAVTNMIGGWVQSASEFETIMRQVRFLGQVTEQEYAALTDRIIDLGVALPTSNLKVAEGVLDSLRLGFSAEQAELMAEPIALMEFFSQGALTTADSAQFLNAIMKMMNLTAEDSSMVLDKLLSTMRYTAFDMGELWQAWRSASDMPGYLEGELEDYLALLAVTRTGMIPRRAAQTARSFLQTLYTAMASGGTRGGLWSILGIDLDAEKDPLTVLEKVSERSLEVWGDTADRTANLMSMLGQRGMATVIMYEKYMASADKTIQETRDLIRESEGFAEDYLEEMLYTFEGMSTVLSGTIDTLRQLLGDLVIPVLVPLLQRLQQFFAYAISFVREYPAFSRLVVIITGLGGAFAVVAGTMMLFGGQLFSIYGSLMNVTLQLAALRVNSSRAFQEMGLQATTVGGLLRLQIGRPLAAIRRAIFRIIGLSTLFYLVWRYDFLRIRSTIDDFFENMRNASESASLRMTEMTGDMVHELLKADLASEEFWDRITGYLTIAKIMWEGFTQGIKSFREEGLVKLNQDIMSLLTGLDPEELMGMDEINPDKFPLLRSLTMVFDIMFAIKSLWDGFVSGLNSAHSVIDKFIIQPLEAIFGPIFDNFRLFSWDEELERYRPDLGVWENFGNILGRILGYALAIKVTLFTWKVTIGKLIGLVGGIKGLFSSGGLLGTIFGSRSKLPLQELQRAGNIKWTGGIRPSSLTGQGWNLREVGLGRKLPFGLDKIFGQKVYASKTGEYLGKTGGILPRAIAKRFQDYPGLRGPDQILRSGLGKIPGAGMLKGLGGSALGKFASRIPILAPALMGLSALTADRGERVQAVTETGVGIGGAMLGAKAGAALGTAILPGIGTVAAAIIGGITGSILISPLGETLGKWVQDAFNWVSENLFSLDGLRNFFETIRLIVVEKIPERVGYWLGTLLGTVAGFFANLVKDTIPSWFGRIVSGLEGWGASITEWWDSLGGNLYEQIIGFFTSVVEGILNIPKTIMGTVYDGLGSLIDGAVSGLKRGYEETRTPTPLPPREFTYTEWATGGLVTRPTFGMAGEDGPEAIIPLGAKHRNTAVGLMERAGRIVNPSTGGGNSQTVNVDFKENSIVLKVDSLDSRTDIRRTAKELFEEFKHLIEEENIRNYGLARVGG